MNARSAAGARIELIAMTRWLCVSLAHVLIVCALFACGPSSGQRASAPRQAAAGRESTVGMPARIEELVLPGAEIVVAPLDARSPMVLRITRTSPHGTAFRYDIEYSGLDPGEYDLRRFLRRKDGASIDTAGSDVPPIPVSIRTVLAAGQVKPHPPEEGAVPSFGGYRTLLIVGGSLWSIGLLALLFARRKRERSLEGSLARPRTLAERLRPLVERAQAGTLSRSERAALELSLVAYWRRKLGLEERRPEEALELLRAHAEAGPLLIGLENWLHRPASHAAVDPVAVDVGALLAPYRNLPPDALDAELDPNRARASPRRTGLSPSH